MYCSGCGEALAAGLTLCPKCGRPVALAVPPVPGFEYQVANYAGKVRTLGVLWLAYSVFALVLGFAGIAFAREFFAGHFGWMHGPLPPGWMVPAWIHFAWMVLVVRAVLYAVAGWGLLERAQWGRIVALVAAILCLIKFPFGTALGIATLVILLGARNWTLYENL